MKTYLHARLGKAEQAALAELKRATGLTESEIVRRGLHLLVQEERHKQSALDLAGSSVGRFAGGPIDLSSNPAHLAGFGK